jgi:hypothetical protein
MLSCNLRYFRFPSSKPGPVSCVANMKLQFLLAQKISHFSETKDISGHFSITSLNYNADKSTDVKTKSGNVSAK